MNLKLSPEAKVGALFLASLALVAGFIWYLGVLNPFSSVYELKVGYNFAGGVEVGSPVRVMGIKVGKVKSIDFAPDQKSESGEEVKLSITLTISKEAWPTVHRDSRFYINLAGVIGEKFIEITPGAAESPCLSLDSSYEEKIHPESTNSSLRATVWREKFSIWWRKTRVQLSILSKK